jgi:hypothetical protein
MKFKKYTNGAMLFSNVSILITEGFKTNFLPGFLSTSPHRNSRMVSAPMRTDLETQTAVVCPIGKLGIIVLRPEVEIVILW